MNAFYFQKSSKESLALIVEKLSKKYQNIAIFQVVSCGECSCSKIDSIDFISLFSTDEGCKIYLEDENYFYKEAIKKFNELKSRYDFVLVSSFNKFAGLDAFSLNLRLSKELNINYVVEDENKVLFAKKHNVNAFLFNKETQIEEILSLNKPNFLSPMAFEIMLENKAKENIKTVVLPEGCDDRILKAADILLKTEAINLIILGNNQEIAQRAAELNLDLDGVKTINPGHSQYDDEFANALYEARKSKGMSEEKAKELIKDRNYFGTLLVHLGYADAMVSGAACTTADTIRPALQLVKTKKGVNSVSGGFFVCLEDKVWFFADCAVTPNPTPENSAECAYVSANTYKAFGLEPKVAMLSYSTLDSASGPSVDAVKQAVSLAKEYAGLIVDGPMQLDAAVDKTTAKSKMPNSEVAGNANVFIFPDLNAANIGYKAVQRTANAMAIGPLLQGLNKPINDLSRGCRVEDIVNTCLITAIQAQ